MVKYVQIVTNDDGWSDWVKPVVKGYRLGCCDCGLVHSMEFRIKNGRVVFRTSRNNRSTGQVRRWMAVDNGVDNKGHTSDNLVSDHIGAGDEEPEF